VVNARTKIRWLPLGLVIGRSPAHPEAPQARLRAKTAILSGIVAAIGLHLSLIAVAAESFLVRDPQFGDLESRLSRVERERPSGGSLVLFLGTSRVGTGFSAKRVGEQAPIAAFNFGVPGSGPITHQIYLRRLLAAGHRPELLLLEVLPSSVAELDGGPPEARLLDGARFTRQEIETLTAYGVPGERLRDQWRETVATPWLGLRFSLLGRVMPSALPAHRRHDEGRTGDAWGWHRIMEEALTPEMFAQGAAHTRREYGKILATLRPGGDAGRALRDTLALANDHGIPVRLVLMPEATWFREMYPLEVLTRFDRWVHDLARDAGTPVTDARGWIPDSGFADGHHLLPGGAAKFTDRLTREVITPHFVPAMGVTQ